MFRQTLRLAPRTLVSAGAAAAVLVHEHESRRDKFSIYPTPDAEILVQDVPSELEHQIGTVRAAVTGTYDEAHARVQAVVSRWIGIEQGVENRLKSFLAPSESLTPGVLYIGVATLTGSVLTRTRGPVLRTLLPPTLLLLAFHHFLPQTAHNVAAYAGALEDAYAPALAEKHEVAKAHSSMAWEMVRERTREGREGLGRGVGGVVDRVQGATGLKIREALGVYNEKKARGGVVEEVKERAVEAANVVEKTVQEVKEVVLEKVEEVREAVGEKTEEAKEGSGEKGEGKRLV